MQLANDGLVLWYGTPDAPAPGDMEQASTNVTVTVGVQPPGPSNVVSIHYRVDGGALRVLRAVHLRTDYARRTQYFRARFPDFWNGEQVEYVPVLTCAGRSVPGPAHLTELPSVFHVPPRAAQPRSRAEPRGSPLRQPLARFSFDLEFVAQVTVRLRNQPEIIGSTPAGYVASWYPEAGEVQGPRLSARVLTEGTHSLTVQPDGIGLVQVEVSLKTDDDALIRASYNGITDLGVDGYASIVQGEWPTAPRIRVVPRFLTAASRYAWLNRLQCAGFGELRPMELIYAYDLYALL
jgi:hypothetical protein